MRALKYTKQYLNFKLLVKHIFTLAYKNYFAFNVREKMLNTFKFNLQAFSIWLKNTWKGFSIFLKEIKYFI